MPLVYEILEKLTYISVDLTVIFLSKLQRTRKYMYIAFYGFFF